MQGVPRGLLRAIGRMRPLDIHYSFGASPTSSRFLRYNRDRVLAFLGG